MIISLLAVTALGVMAWMGAQMGLQYVFAACIPYTALIVFLIGFAWRIMDWARRPVPFRIPTTGGQQKSLPWIKPASLDNPSDKTGVVIRMILEVLLFRSLFRNTKMTIENGDRVVYWSNKYLWLFALIFHYCFLIIFIRHFRFFMEPVPFLISAIETLDGMMQIGVPRLFMTDALIVLALCYLLGRRLFDQKVKYISLINDYFPLCLILGLVGSGISMRYFTKVDIASVKTFAMSLVNLSPDTAALANIGAPFLVHMFFLSVLLMYFPFSKLMHMGGVFLSPTRNLPNDSRVKLHVNPWNPAKEYRTYEEYEDEFRDAMYEAGLPVVKLPEDAE
ncbi:MAG: sulfate reduction electron transfer complex DsrMKJOP subunit DsrM [Halodesulfovibrio sp.]